jgi:cell division protein FtsB
MSSFLKELRASWLAISMLLVAGILFISAASGDRGITKGLALENELDEINQASFLLMQEIDQTRDQIRQVDQDDEALEMLARQRLHMVRPGDTLYRIGTEN